MTTIQITNHIISLKEEFNLLEHKIENTPMEFTNPLKASEVYCSHVRRQGEIRDTLSELTEKYYETLLEEVELLEEEITNLPNSGVIQYEKDTNAVTWADDAQALFDEIEHINKAIKVCLQS